MPPRNKFDPWITVKSLPLDACSASRVPYAGELLIDNKTGEIRIGDGKNAYKDLPIVSSGISLSTAEEMTTFGSAFDYIKYYSDLIDANDFDTFFNKLPTSELRKEIYGLLVEAGIDPKPYLSDWYRYECGAYDYATLEDFQVYLKEELNKVFGVSVGTSAEYTRWDTLLDKWGIVEHEG